MTYIILIALGLFLYYGYKGLLKIINRVNEDSSISEYEEKKRDAYDSKKLSDKLSEVQLKILLNEKVETWKRIYILKSKDSPMTEEFVFETSDCKVEFKTRYSDFLKKYYVYVKENNTFTLKMELNYLSLAYSNDTLKYIENMLKEKSKVFNNHNETIKVSKMNDDELSAYREKQEISEKMSVLRQKKYLKTLTDTEARLLIDFENREEEEMKAFEIARQRILDEKKAKQMAEKVETLRRINESAISSNVADYIIGSEDFRRNNEKELQYRRKNKLFIFKLYDNKCAKCGDSENGVDLDHLAVPKSMGGNFVLKTKSGVLVNNSVPLCEKCNRSKGARNYRKFFSDNEILYILNKNREMNNRINE